LHIGNANGIEQVVIRNIAGAMGSRSVAIFGKVIIFAQISQITQIFLMCYL